MIQLCMKKEKIINYSMTYSDGLCIYMGSIKDGENTIIVSANGYKDKKIIVNVDKTAKTVTFVSQKRFGIRRCSNR